MRNECNCDPLGFGGHDENCPRAGKSEGIPTRPTPKPVAGLVEEFTATIKFAAHEWWRVQGMNGTVEEVEIGRDGRVTVRWKDAEERGRYGLPVDFLQALTAPAPDVTDAMVEATAKAIYEEKCFNALLIGNGRSEWLGMDCDARLHRKAIRLAKAALAAQGKPEPQPALTDAQSEVEQMRDSLGPKFKHLAEEVVREQKRGAQDGSTT